MNRSSNVDWVKLETPDQLNAIKEGSNDKTVLIFKHSTRCSVSVMTLSRLERDWQSMDMKAVTAYYLDLLNHRELSNAVAHDFGVPHESPQVMLIRNGQAFYDRSHVDIQYPELARVAAGAPLTR